MFEKLKKKFRKHSFDLNNPIVVKVTHRYSYTKYICKNCGHSLSLERWQMEDLPFNMARGCPGINKD